jgi:hypothetical protein
MRLRFTWVLVALALASCPATGWAEEPKITDAQRAAGAEDLFQRAKALIGEKKYQEACPLLAESYRLDPAGGTLQNLAVCYVESGKTASAYARFQELRSVSQLAKPPRLDRMKVADDQIAQLTPRLCRIRVQIAPGARTPGMVVNVDGVDYMEEASFAVGVPADPGSHVITVRAPHKVTLEKRADVSVDGATVTVNVEQLASAPEPQSPREKAGPSPPAQRSTLGFALLGVGVAALGTGAAMGVLAIVKNGQGKDACNGQKNATAPRTDFDPSGHCYSDTQAFRDAASAKSQATTFANVANVLVPIGAVCTGIGAYLVLRSPRSAGDRSTRLVPALGGAMLQGTF